MQDEYVKDACQASIWLQHFFDILNQNIRETLRTGCKKCRIIIRHAC